METLTFGIDPGRIAESLNSIAPRARAFLREGVPVLARLSRSHTSEALAGIKTYLASQGSYGQEDIKPLLDATEDLNALLGAGSLIVTMTAHSELSPEKIVAALVEAQLVAKAEEPALLAFVQTVARERASLRNILDSSSIASEILPSLTVFETTVDIRVKLPDPPTRSSAVAVPVAILHIDTDSDVREMWCQLTRWQLRKMIDDLTKTLKAIEQAEILAKQLVSQRPE